MFGIPGKEIRAQLKRDLIGKDSHRGVTLTYAWIANQFGHFALGFIPSFVIFLVLNRYTQWDQPAFWSALIISGFWLSFEIYNFLGPLLFKKSPKSNYVFMGGPTYLFKPRWGFIAFDTSTDVLFFILGSFSCASIIDPWQWNLTIAIAVQVILLYPIAYWFTSKMQLQNSGFPMQFRLSQWNQDISERDINKINAFRSSEEAQHLLIFGSRGTGKSPLAIGIASDVSTQKKRSKCSYYTGIKLCCHFYQSENEFDSPLLWDWSSSDCLIIDDINPGLPMTKDIVEPKEFLSFMDDETYGNRNKEILRKKKVIWVMGENHSTKAKQLNDWQNVIQSIGVSPENIVVVDLTNA